MSGGFFRGTSADQDTRFSNKQAKLLKTQKFPPELEHLVDITKVKMDVIKPWIATRVTEFLGGFEDEVLINFIYGLLEGKEINGKAVQIQLTGFMEKNTGKFMKELWALLLSAQKNASGVPQQFLDAKEEETRKKKAETDRIFSEIQKRKDQETEQDRERKMDGGPDTNSAEEANRRRGRGSGALSGDENGADVRNGFRRRNRSSKSPYSSRSPSPHRERISGSPRPRRQPVSPEMTHRSPLRRSISPRERTARESVSPRRRSPSRRRFSSRTRYGSPSLSKRSFRSPARRGSPSPPRRGSPSPRRRSPSLRCRSRSPLRRRSPRWRRSPSPWRRRLPSPRRRRSPSPVRQRRRRSTSSPRSRSPTPVRRRFQSPVRRSAYSVRRRSPSPHRRVSSTPKGRRSRTPVRRRSSSLVRRRSPVGDRRKSPTPSARRSPSLESRSSGSPARDSSASPVKIKSPFGSPREESRNTVMARRRPIAMSPQRDQSDRSHSRRNVPSVSPSPQKSPSHIESPLPRTRDSGENKRLASPCDSPVNRAGYPITLDNGQSPPTDSRVQRVRHGSPRIREEQLEYAREDANKHMSTVGGSVRSSGDKKTESIDRLTSRPSGGNYSRQKDNEMTSVDVIKEVRATKKSPLRGSESGERPVSLRTGDGFKFDDKKSSHSRDARDYSRSETLANSQKRRRSPSVDSDSGSDGSDKGKVEVADKRKHRRSSRREVASDATSSESEMEDRKEAKRRRKEEKKLRKEERRRRHEERRRRKEEKRASKRKRKSKDADALSSDMENIEKDANASNGDRKTKKYSSEEEETESQKKRLEIELREKALESLRAKKGVNR